MVPAQAVEDRSATVARIVSTNAEAVLERLSGTDLLRRGCVNIIALDAIRDRLGDRWERRREQVWDHAVRCIDQRLGEGDLTAQISDTEFLICLTRDSGVTSQVASTRILEEVLVRFLGACKPSDLVLRTVTAVNGKALSCQTLDSEELVKSARSAPDSALGKVQSAAARRYVEHEVTVTSMGRRLQVSFNTSDWLSLRHGVRAALWVRPEVRDLETKMVLDRKAYAALESTALAKIDEATASFLVDLFNDTESAEQWSIIAPVSLQTISLGRSRQGYIALLDQCLAQCRSRLVLELQNIEPGTPRGRIAEAVGIAQRHCRAVFVRTGPSRSVLESLSGLRLLGVVVDAAELGVGPEELASGLLGYSALSKPLSCAIAVTRLPSAAMIAAAKLAGFTHGTVAGAEAAAAATRGQFPAPLAPLPGPPPQKGKGA